MYSTNMGSNVKINVFVLLTISMYGGLFLAVWNLHTQSASLKYENVNLQNQISELRGFVGANPNPHSSDEVTVMDTLKRLTRQSSSSQSATDLLADALAELIEKKLYTIMDCARDDADNLTDCSLKPGPKGDKGCLGDQGKEGPQGMNGEPGVKGHIGYPGHKGEVGPKGPTAIPAQWGKEGLKEIWARSVNEVIRVLKASKVRKDIMVSLDTKARVALKEIEALEAIMDKRERKE
ncbi:collagen alpha-1(XVII) chain-like [Halichondria panicea]|uniref:collagen alpha-1(XVII) chain-like n=1 Tax=Halichondria panicea TaxID=6063 RepID=UPI00312BBF3D